MGPKKWNVVVCTIIGFHNLIRSSTIWRCGFFGMGMVLLEEVCHCGVDFEVTSAKDTAQYLNKLPVACRMKDSELLFQYQIYLFAACYLS